MNCSRKLVLGINKKNKLQHKMLYNRNKQQLKINPKKPKNLQKINQFKKNYEIQKNHRL